jgi:type VI secretion system protein ImpL
MLGKEVLRIVLYGVGLSSLAAVIYLAGPFVAFGDWHPLENYIIRDILVVLLVSAGGAFIGFQFWRRKKSSEQIAEGIAADAAQDTDATVLKERMKDALATLKQASGGKKGDFLYDLPWYVLIGPPGSGKTTALINSGLKFPLSRGATPAAVAGVGGTRYCDWWFTEDAVLIDTAGRYTTQDSDAKADKDSWFSFLDLLKKNRPRQPINGVMVAISLEDLMTLPAAEINAHAAAIRARLLELHDRLKVDFPVYALFTKGDLVAGFTEFFGNLSEQERKQVWGATFQTNDKTRNLVGDVPAEFDALVERLNSELIDRLQEEPAPNTRLALFGFPTQMAALKRPVFDFLNQIFEPTRYHANATLRGFYFTSGTQEGTPIDQLIGAIAKSFGAEEVGATSYSGLGKSFFLTDLIRKVVIGEAAWVSTDRNVIRRARILKTAAYACLVLVTVGLAGAWVTSYSRNSDLITRTDNALAEYRAAAGPLANESKIGDRDFAKILPALHRLRFLPAGYVSRNSSAPLFATFGLNQRNRLLSAAETVYHIALERMFRSRLIYRLEEVLDAHRNDPSYIYEALKVYMMLGGQHRADPGLIMAWAKRDWEQLYPGPTNAPGREALEQHLVAMLDLAQGEDPSIGLNGPLLAESQKTLARLSVAERAYQLLKSQARASTTPDWIPERQGGIDFDRVFTTVDGAPIESVRVPGFFTYAGFQHDFIARLASIAEQIKADRWVLGQAGTQAAIDVQYSTLEQSLLDLYSRDFVATWHKTLNRLKLRPFTADKPKYLVLAAVSAPTSPLKELLESIVREAALTRERKDVAKAKAAAKAKPSDTQTASANGTPSLLRQQDRAPGAQIEAAFKAFQVATEGSGGQRPIDQIVSNLAAIRQSLILLQDPVQAPQARAQLQTQFATLRANAPQLPAPFSDMLLKAVGVFEGDLTHSNHAQLQRALAEQVTSVCEQIVPNRYPFDRSSREVPLVDFARLFAPNGILDKFFKQHLEPLVDTSHRTWAWRKEIPLSRSLLQSTLTEFQRAAAIRDAFFATGGNMPLITVTVVPPPVVGFDAKLEINGMTVESKPSGNVPVAIQWPGATSINRTAISVSVKSGGGLFGFGQQLPPSVLERVGPWSLFRMLDAASPIQRNDRLIATFIVGGQELQYQFSAGSLHNPLHLPALREFRCPNGI